VPEDALAQAHPPQGIALHSAFPFVLGTVTARNLADATEEACDDLIQTAHYALKNGADRKAIATALYDCGFQRVCLRLIADTVTAAEQPQPQQQQQKGGTHGSSGSGGRGGRGDRGNTRTTDSSSPRSAASPKTSSGSGSVLAAAVESTPSPLALHAASVLEMACRGLTIGMTLAAPIAAADAVDTPEAAATAAATFADTTFAAAAGESGSVEGAEAFLKRLAELALHPAVPTKVQGSLLNALQNLAAAGTPTAALESCVITTPNATKKVHRENTGRLSKLQKTLQSHSAASSGEAVTTPTSPPASPGTGSGTYSTLSPLVPLRSTEPTRRSASVSQTRSHIAIARRGHATAAATSGGASDTDVHAVSVDARRPLRRNWLAERRELTEAQTQEEARRQALREERERQQQVPSGGGGGGGLNFGGGGRDRGAGNRRSSRDRGLGGGGEGAPVRGNDRGPMGGDRGPGRQQQQPSPQQHGGHSVVSGGGGGPGITSTYSKVAAPGSSPGIAGGTPDLDMLRQVMPSATLRTTGYGTTIVSQPAPQQPHQQQQQQQQTPPPQHHGGRDDRRRGPVGNDNERAGFNTHGGSQPQSNRFGHAPPPSQQPLTPQQQPQSAQGLQPQQQQRSRRSSSTVGGNSSSNRRPCRRRPRNNSNSGRPKPATRRRAPSRR
jgi:hypothetical protein